MSILHLTPPHLFPTINPFKIRCKPSRFSHAFTLSATRYRTFSCSNCLARAAITSTAIAQYVVQSEQAVR